MKKTCKTCGENKEIDFFYIHENMRDGRINDCKTCTIQNVKTLRNKNPKKYDQTEKGVLRVMYKTQKRKAMLRNSYINYTKDQLKDWLYENGFKKLYDNWVESGYQKNFKPSVDRLDTFIGYDFENIRLVTWGENKKAQSDDILKARGTSGRRCKSVAQINMDGTLVSTFPSQNIASRKTGVSNANISLCCLGKTKSAGGFKWVLL